MKNFLTSGIYLFLALSASLTSFSCENCYKEILNHHDKCFHKILDMTCYYEETLNDEQLKEFIFLQGMKYGFKLSMKTISENHEIEFPIKY